MKNLLIFALVVIEISGHFHRSAGPNEQRPRTFYGYIEPKTVSHSFSESFGPKLCSTIIDCGSSQLCVDGKCVVDNGHGGRCSSDAYCPNGFVCIDGKCAEHRRRFALPCVHECMPGQICVKGECQSIPMFQFS